MMALFMLLPVSPMIRYDTQSSVPDGEDRTSSFSFEIGLSFVFHECITRTRLFLVHVTFVAKLYILASR